MKKRTQPDVQPIAIKDITAAITAGISDFRKAPFLGIALAAIFVLGGWLLLALLNVFKLPFLAYPLAAGFAFVAPFAAVGFYAISAHLEAGKSPSWNGMLTDSRAAWGRDLRWMALVTGFALIIWMDIAAFLFFIFVGFSGFGADFFEKLLTTSSGLSFLLVGNLTGAVLAIFVFSISAVSFPMLFERDVDFVTAMVTSVRVVKKSPIPMLFWCALIGVSMLLSILSGLLGLLLVMPIVGHATWRLYRLAVGPQTSEAPAASVTA